MSYDELGCRGFVFFLLAVIVCSDSSYGGQGGEGTVADPFYITTASTFRERGQDVFEDIYFVGTSGCRVLEYEQIHRTCILRRNTHGELYATDFFGGQNEQSRASFWDLYGLLDDVFSSSAKTIACSPPQFKPAPDTTVRVSDIQRWVDNKVTSTMHCDPILDKGSVNAIAEKECIDGFGSWDVTNTAKVVVQEKISYNFDFHWRVIDPDPEGPYGYVWNFGMARSSPFYFPEIPNYTYSSSSEDNPAKSPPDENPVIPGFQTELQWIFAFFTPSQLNQNQGLLYWSQGHPSPIPDSFNIWTSAYVFEGIIL